MRGLTELPESLVRQAVARLIEEMYYQEMYLQNFEQIYGIEAVSMSDDCIAAKALNARMILIYLIGALVPYGQNFSKDDFMQIENEINTLIEKTLEKKDVLGMIGEIDKYLSSKKRK